MLDGTVCFSLGLTLAYGAIMVLYWVGWRRLPVWQIPVGFIPSTTVSVVIPARNEARHIAVCLDSILANMYPNHLMEVLVVDDFSADNTGECVLEIAARQEINIRLLRLSDISGSPDASPTGKKRAIETAVAQAHGELIVATDADCRVPSDWLLFLTSAYEYARPKAICGPVLVHPQHRMLQYFEALDVAGMMGITGAGIHQKWQHLGNGAHLAYSKAAFEAVGGFTGNTDKASGDDLFLLQKIAQRWPEDIFFLKNAGAAVITAAQPDLSSFIRQRLRWGTKNKALPESAVKSVLAVVFLFCCSILLNASLAFFYPVLGTVALCQLAVKAGSDYLLLREVCVCFKRRAWMHWFWPSFFLHILYIAGIGMASLFVRKYTWKGRLVE